jgi:hypothetical protein
LRQPSGRDVLLDRVSAGPRRGALGTYTGNAVDDREITGLGFAPDYVVIFDEIGDYPLQRSSAMPGDVSFTFEADPQPNRIQALRPDGFQLGTTDVNRNGVGYHYVAWRAVPGRVAVGSYAGDGSDDRSLDIGFDAGHVLVHDGVSQDSQLRPQVMADTPQSLALRCYSDCVVSNRIQAFVPSGFQVGSHGDVNANGGTFFYVAFE